MELREIDAQTEDTYYRCLHDEIPANPRVMAMRRAWRAEHAPLGHRAKLLFDDAGRIVGLTNYIPIEHSPYVGEGLMAILCMWIHGYAHGVGNQQARGFGRFMLEAIEGDARQSGSDGMAVWAKDYDAWNPIAFYEHMGYERVATQGLDVLAWKPFNDQARPPAFLPRRIPVAATGDKVRLTSINTGWCSGGCQSCLMARDAAAALPEQVVLDEVSGVRASDPETCGESLDALYIDGDPFRPDGPPYGEQDLMDAIRGRIARR